MTTGSGRPSILRATSPATPSSSGVPGSAFTWRAMKSKAILSRRGERRRTIASISRTPFSRAARRRGTARYRTLPFFSIETIQSCRPATVAVTVSSRTVIAARM